MGLMFQMKEVHYGGSSVINCCLHKRLDAKGAYKMKALLKIFCAPVPRMPTDEEVVAYAAANPDTIVLHGRPLTRCEVIKYAACSKLEALSVRFGFKGTWIGRWIWALRTKLYLLSVDPA
jgi:hypothetical protein